MLYTSRPQTRKRRSASVPKWSRTLPPVPTSCPRSVRSTGGRARCTAKARRCSSLSRRCWGRAACRHQVAAFLRGAGDQLSPSNVPMSPTCSGYYATGAIQSSRREPEQRLHSVMSSRQVEFHPPACLCIPLLLNKAGKVHPPIGGRFSIESVDRRCRSYTPDRSTLPSAGLSCSTYAFLRRGQVLCIRSTWDNLTLAEMYGTTVENLLLSTAFTNPDTIRIGQEWWA